MLSKNKFKYIQSLRLKKNRTKLNKFIIEGEKMVNDYLDQNTTENIEIWATSNWNSNYNTQTIINEITDKELKSISSLTTPNKVLLIADIPNIPIPDLEEGWYLYLNELQDPGNMGTILRSAYWFGLDGIILSPNCVDIYNPKVVQASMSSLFHLKIYTQHLDKIISRKELNIFATAMNGTSIKSFIKPHNGIIIMGNEGNGIPQDIINQCKDTLTIPAGKNEHSESLNVGVASSILMSYICI